MNISTLSLVVAIVGIAALSLVLAIPAVRSRLIGQSNLRNALVPLAAGGLLWLAVSGGDLLKGRIEESTIPEDVVRLHIQSVDFGIPQIPTDYLQRNYSAEHVKAALRPLTESNSNLNLTGDEIDRLNRIAQASGMVDQLHKNRVYSTRDVATAVTAPLAFTFNYLDWSKVSLAWANFLTNSPATEDRNARLRKFVNVIELQLTAAGLFQGITGIAWREEIEIPQGNGDCLAAKNGIAQVEEDDDHIVLTFPTFRTVIARTSDSQGRRRAALNFAHLFEFSCVDSLATVFKEASASFQQEADLMRSFVDEWNRILASKQPETIKIRVALSNLGRFDSFVRTTAKVSVGPVGDTDPLVFFATDSAQPSSDDGESSERQDGFLQVKTRSNVVAIFSARLSADMQKRLYGAYQSEQGYLRLGVLASAGSSEAPILSQIAPFSTEAKNAFDRMVQDMKIPISRKP